MRKFIYVLFVGIAFLLMGASGCDSTPTSDSTQKQQQEVSAQEANRQVGMPNIVNYQEKKQLKMIYETCDQENLICYAYYSNTMQGKRGDFIGKCIGYGVPYSTQFSNPQKVVQSYSQSYGTLPQAEPNQLFKPEGLSATWLLLINPKDNTIHPGYFECDVIVSPFPLEN